MEFDVSPFANDTLMPESPTDVALGANTVFQRDHKKRLQELLDVLNEAVSEASDSAADPVAVHVHPAEKVEILDMTHPNTELFNKIMATFTTLCDEINELCLMARGRYLPALALFGRQLDEDEWDSKPGALEVEMGRMLPMLQQVGNFAERCNALVLNLVQQLSSLYAARWDLYQRVYKNVQLTPVYESLADLFETLITIDHVVRENHVLGTAWEKYKNLMPLVVAAPDAYGMDEASAQRHEHMLLNLNQTVMAGACFQFCVRQNFNVSPGDDVPRINVSSNEVFLNELCVRLTKMAESLARVIGQPMETIEKRRLVGTFGLYVLHRRLLPNSIKPSKDLYKQLWRTQETIPLIPLYGRAVWIAADFLNAHTPAPTKSLKPKKPEAHRLTCAKRTSENMEASVHGLYTRLTSWLVQVETVFAPLQSAKPSVELLHRRGQLMLEGMLLACQGRNMWQAFVAIHMATESPIRKRNIQPLSLCVELLKVIEFAFRRKNASIAECQSLLLRHMASEILDVFRPLKRKLQGRLNHQKREILLAVNMLERVLMSTESLSASRRLVMRLAIRVAVQKGSPVQSASAAVARTVWMVDMLADWQRTVQQACDCSGLFWSQELLPAMLQNIYDRPQQINRVHYIVAAFGDAARFLEAGSNNPADALQSAGGTPVKVSEAVDKYKKDVLQTLHDVIIAPTQKLVEADLRMHIHAVRLAKHVYNPKNPRMRRPPLCPVLFLRPVRCFNQTIDIKEIVTHYLQTTFYNLTTVALYDWKTYGEMANLAKDKFDITLADNHLPMGELNQGIDILKIMRNIHLFVKRFNYNQNQQLFVEKRSDRGAKHLNVVNIESISSSIRTHGTGMMNTTVSFAYQFLRRKFFVFSQFLFDDYIRSHLSRQIRYFEKQRQKLKNMYPHDNAYQFTRDIMKLGMDGNMSFLDKFRVLITEIGNTLGYVRMVRSAGMHVCSEAVQFIPDLQNVMPFTPYVGEGDEDTRDVAAKLSPHTVAAAQNLDNVVNNLVDRLQEESDFLKILVKVVQEKMNTADHPHLQNFYMIVPSLTLNYVNSIRMAKDLMTKSVKGREAYFTDDGFALGIAYILSVLKQGPKLASLHWWDSIRAKFAAEGKELQAMSERASKNRKKNSDELTELAFKEKRLQTRRHEFGMLYFSFTGAQIFFRGDAGAEEADTKSKDPPAAAADTTAAGTGAGAGAGAGAAAGAGDAETPPALQDAT